MTFEVEEDSEHEAVIEETHDELATEHGRDNVLVTVNEGDLITIVGEGVGLIDPMEFNSQPVKPESNNENTGWFIERYQSGVEESQLTLTEDGSIEVETTTGFKGNCIPLFKVYIPQLDKPVEFECPKSELVDLIRIFCEDKVKHGALDKVPPRLIESENPQVEATAD